MTDVLSIELNDIRGKPATLAEHAGKVILVVNVASQCGLTPQYAGLIDLYRRYRDRGFVVAGFPSNDFAGQEPGSSEEIEQFCSATYGVDFPMYAKIPVSGPDKHPLYAALTEAVSLGSAGDAFRDQLKGYGMVPASDPEVLWNFEKFLVSRDGLVVARFAPSTAPDDPELIAKIETELSR